MPRRLSEGGGRRRAPATIGLPPGCSLGAALLAIFEQACESQLIQPTLVYDYPVEASPLSKNKPGDPNWVERFEIYVAGMEIANAYSELNDPQEQRRRFLAQVERRGAGDGEAHADGRGLPAGAVLRHAANRRRRHRHRPADDGAHQFALDPRRDSVPAAAARRRVWASPAGWLPSTTSMAFEIFVARRYLRAKRKHRFISAVTVISVVGVATGVMALIVAMAINNGVQQEMRNQLLGATSHVYLLEKERGFGIENWQSYIERFRKIEHVKAMAPALYRPGA